MTNDPFYIIGRRADEARADKARAGERMTNVPKSNLRAKDSVSVTHGCITLRTLGWSTATFCAEAILGWIIKEKFS